MAGARSSTMINGARFSSRFSGRPIPKRGQVKLAIVVILAHSVASIFSLNNPCGGGAQFSLQ